MRDHRTRLIATIAKIADISGNTREDWMKRNRLLLECQDTIDSAIEDIERLEDGRMDLKDAQHADLPLGPLDVGLMLRHTFGPFLAPSNSSTESPCATTPPPKED